MFTSPNSPTLSEKMAAAREAAVRDYYAGVHEDYSVNDLPDYQDFDYDNPLNHIPRSPVAAPENDASYQGVNDAIANLSSVPVGSPTQQHGNVDSPLLNAIAGGDDTFPELSQFLGENAPLHNDAGNHGHADEPDNFNNVRDAFAALPAVPEQGFELSVEEFLNNNVPNDFSGVGNFPPGDFEQNLQRVLAGALNDDAPSAHPFGEFGHNTPPTNNDDRALVPYDGGSINNDNATLVPYDGGANAEEIPDNIVARLLAGGMSPNTQARTVDGLDEHSMDRTYNEFMRSHGFKPKASDHANAPMAFTAPTSASGGKAPGVPGGMIPKTSTKSSAVTTTKPKDPMTEENYQPTAWEPEFEMAVDPTTPDDGNTSDDATDATDPVDPNAPPPPPLEPIYPAYTARFKDADAARSFRKRNRLPPKSEALDVERVRKYGRMYWVRRIYDSMIDRTSVVDSPNSIHRTRFCVEPAFNPLDLEAAAHHVFDEALAVHERGWNRPQVYHKKVVRGKLTDVSEKCLERRLARICLCLRQKKATVDDAMRGGVTLALLCDNPEARGFTKLSNNAGNAKRGERLKAAKEAGVGEVVQAQVGEYEEESEESEEP